MQVSATISTFSGMDANSSTGNKRRKHNEGDAKSESVTKLSDLPSEILQEIISKLSVKEAIQTAVLSKKWRNQWKHISRVRLVEKERYGKRQEFIDFVENLLAVLNTSCLKVFSLSFDVGEDTSQVNRWLSGFIKPVIEELSLDFEGLEEPLVFPDDLFRSKDLTHFHLSMPHLIMLPSSISFPSLSIMTLREVIFPDTLSTQQLFTGCPSLEQLTLIDCNWKNVRTVHIVCPSLQILIIREWEDDDYNSYGAFSHNVPTCCRIVITVSNLKTFSYDGDLINDYILDSTSSIIDGAVEVHLPPNNAVNAGLFVLRLLKALSDVEKLSISDFTAEALCRESSLIPEIPLFNNLLELHVESVEPMDLSCDALLTIMRRSPLLEVVDFSTGVFLHEEAVNKVHPLPACLGTSLKTIRIYDFTGSREEMFAIKLILKSTPVLDSLWVFSNPYGFNSDEGLERLNKLFKKIVRFARASVDCELFFE